MMHAASREALATLRRRFESADVPVGELSALAQDLYAVSGLLVAQPRLRRTLADPATAPAGRSGLAASLLAGKVGAAANALVGVAVEQRWSSPWDLADGLEAVGDDALITLAAKQDLLDEVEDELFRFERVLDVESRFTTLLDELSVPAPRRTTLLRGVLEPKVQPVTLALLVQAVASTRRRSIELAIDHLLEAAAAFQDRSVARVVSAVALTTEQERRLATVLEHMYGRPIAVRTAIEPSVRGGLLIRVGDEVIDGSVAGRFAAARKALSA